MQVGDADLRAPAASDHVLRRQRGQQEEDAAAEHRPAVEDDGVEILRARA